MVRFERDRLVIEIASGSSTETWRGLLSELIGLMEAEGSDWDVKKFELYELMLAMLPGDDLLKRMVSEDGGPEVDF